MPGRPRARHGRVREDPQDRRRPRHGQDLGDGLVRRKPRRFAEAEPGQYEYADESTYAEFEVHDDGTVTFGLSCLKVEDLAVMLDALERALAAERTA
ncbi:hypothetical protein [Streptomyces fructofermentans]|uniref:hypothetical protein n=1 Tax=Streptomyces fructofermentans TaxID=152141 RepID=UPI0037AEA9D5